MCPLNQPTQNTKHRPVRVMHFVTGGFSGSTSVAIDLVKATLGSEQFSSTLILRKKKSTPMDRIEKLRAQKIDVELVTGWSHIATVIALVKLFKKNKPDIVVCHGFSEHLWGRYAGLLAKVPHLIHVEHNSQERYTSWKLAQARWLAKFTDKIIGCSEGVRNVLLGLKFPAEKTIAINNGIDLSPYSQAETLSFQERAPNIVMAARFAKQKDHLTLIHAIALLKQENLFPRVYFAGAGSERHMTAAKNLTESLQLHDQIQFLGFCSTVPALLLQNKICVLSTHHEGMPLSLSEGMAAGCAVVASKVVGVQEMIRHNIDGLLVDPQNPRALADALAILLKDSERAEQLGHQARERAICEFGIEKMTGTYNQVFLSLAHKQLIIAELHP
jgi:glycosyltransferase involved in cell wall biosynthesis